MLPTNSTLTSPIYLPGLFSPQEAEHILALPKGPGIRAEIGLGALHSQVLDLQTRRTKTYLIAHHQLNPWIYQRLQQFVLTANQEHYHFDLSFLAPVQALQYEPDGFYDWHLDLGQGENSTRKLSCVAFLSPRESYTGGRLQIESPERELPQNQGDAVIFPAYLRHRVEPVTQGERWTLVAWAHGEPFR